MTTNGKAVPAPDADVVREPRFPPATGPREIASEDLLGGGRSIRIRHGGEVYTLRRTSNGKLILTK
jgi:hemin uptake protein HemP